MIQDQGRLTLFKLALVYLYWRKKQYKKGSFYTHLKVDSV